MEKTESGIVGGYLSSPQNPRNPKCTHDKNNAFTT
jgi:hypothetical protein